MENTKNGISPTTLFRGNTNIWVCVIIFEIMSIIFNISTSIRVSDSSGYILKQTFFIIISFIAILFFQYVKIPLIRKFTRVLWIFSILMVGLMLVFGDSVNSSVRSWLGVNWFDVLRITFLLYMSRIFAQKITEINSSFKNCLRYALLPAIITWILPFRENLSTTICMVILYFALLFISEIKIKYKFYICLICLIGSALILGLYFNGVSLTKRGQTGENRITVWWNEVAHDIPNNNNQTIGSKTAIKTGGIFGTGLGHSQQKYMSQADTDFAFSIFVEECGAVGAIALLIIYGWLFLFALKIINKTEDKFSLYTCYSLILMILVQSFLHIFVNVGLAPNTGQPLPIISRGGSALIINSIALGIIINLSAKTKPSETMKAPRTKTQDTKEKKDEENYIDDNNVKKILSELE